MDQNYPPLQNNSISFVSPEEVPGAPGPDLPPPKKFTQKHLILLSVAGLLITTITASAVYAFVTGSQPSNQPPPSPTPHSSDNSDQPSAPTDCQVGGCSGQLCGELGDELISTCEFRAQYACYQTHGICERQTNGTCGWTQTPQLTSCLQNPPDPDQSQTQTPSAYNPFNPLTAIDQLARARDVQRRADLTIIASSLSLYLVENSQLPQLPPLPMCIGTDPGCIDLASLTVPVYIAQFPTDPSSGTLANTNYKILGDQDHFTLSAQSEVNPNEPITLSR